MALLIALAGVGTPGHLLAQSPYVSYQSQGTYYIGLPVQLSPTSTGVAAPAYGSASVAGYLTNAYYTAFDPQGLNIYVTAYTQYNTQYGVQNGQTLYRVALDGTGRGTAVGSLTNASGVAVDKSGNVWVADQIAKAVYKVPYGSNTLTMVASGFNNPQGLAVDASGNVYVADRGNAALEKIPAAGGAWTTVVSGLSGTNNVTLDAKGNIFIAADGGVYRVPAGGNTASLYFSSNAATGVAIDPSGNLYVADAISQRVTKLLATGGTYIFPVDQATSVALDEFGNVYCGRTYGGYVEEYKLTGGYYLSTPLPAGLSLSNSTGIISGTPTSITPSQLCWVYASNAAGYTQTAFNIAIANPPLPTVSYTSPQTYPPGAAIAALAPASNNVAPLAYQSNAVAVGSGIVNPVGVALDSQGNVFVADDAASVNATPGQIYMVAANGGGQSVVADGISDPTSVATDAAGNLFISDTGLIQIFEVPAGQSYITTGSPELSAIGPIAADGVGNVFTFAPGDHTIYKLPSDLSGESPFASGFSSPAGIAADRAGNVYVSDAGNNNVVKITSNGSSSVVASIPNPGPITVDAAGNLYIVNTQGNLYTIPAGTTTAIQIGSGLTNVSSLAIDGKGIIYYTDINNYALKKISPAGGYFINTPLPAGLSFAYNTGVISGTTTTSSPATNYTVTAYNISGGASTAVNIGVIALAISYSGPDTYTTGTAITPLAPASNGVAAPGYSSSPVALGSGFKFPTGVAFDASGNVYVADENNNAVYKIPVAGGAPVALGSGFSAPLGVAVDAAGNVFVADANNNAVKEIPVGGGAIISLGSGFKTPASVAVDAAGNVYVADFGNLAIKKIPAGGGTPITLATISTNTEGVAVDAAGNVYFGTVFGNQIKMIQAGSGALVNVGSGFSQPRGVVVDAAGNVYIADTGNNVIKEIPAGGGSIITVGSGFKTPVGVAIDPAGNIYIGDGGNAAVKKIKPIGGYFINPVLPAGLSLDKSTGIISGTPSGSIASPSTDYTVFAYNSSSSTSAIVNIKTILAQTITFALPAKTYGNADFSPGATSTNSGTQAITYSSDNTAVATIVSGNIHVVGAGTANITASQAGDATHAAAANVVQPLTVNPAPLTITANHQDMTQGRSVPELTVHYDGFVNGDNSGSLTTLPSITTSGTSSSPPGVYPITASGAAAVNYSISYVDGTLNITAPSSNATLGYLIPSTGTLSPDFASTTTSYTETVANDVTSIAVTPIPNNFNANITVNGTGVPSATRSGEIPLAVGSNVITIVVVAEDGVATQTYTVNVTRQSNSPDLANLVLDGPTLSPAFDYNTTSYSAAVTNAITTIKVTPTVSDANATVTVNGTAVVSGTASASLPLAVGPNTIITVITAPDGTTTKTYTITVTRAGSSNDNLLSLHLSNGALSPAFAATTTAYTASVGNTVSSVTVTPMSKYADATVTVNGVTVPRNTASQPVPLNIGGNLINIIVTAQNGRTTKTYSITVTRAGSSNANLASLHAGSGTLSPVFSASTTSYAVSVANTVTSTTITPKSSQANATITVNGTTVTSGAASGAIPLSVGLNTIAIVVTAQDGTTTRTYTVIVTRAASNDANLQTLALNTGSLSPAFAAGIAAYTETVTGTATAVRVKPVAEEPNATISVNGQVVASGGSSQAITISQTPVTINIVVTAQDNATQKTYAITVAKASNNAGLQSLALNMGSLSPAFATGTTGYTQTVANTVTAVRVKPVTADANATIKVNGQAVTSGGSSQAISLATGTNTITTVVTAQDKSTSKTYTITVTRAMASMNTVYQPVGVEQPVENLQLANDDIIVHQAISPNGDGHNDVLTIDGISNYPDNKLSIMNRSGQLIYEAKGYDNTSKVFDGHSNKTGAKQLPGTYFYSLDYTVKGVAKRKTGFIVLKW